MNKRIMLIGDAKATFILDALRESLIKAEYQVDYAPPRSSDIKEITNTPDMIIFYMGSYVQDAQNVLLLLRDLCIAHKIKIGLIGYNEEVEAARKTITDNFIWHVFERPLNVRDLVDSLGKSFENTKKGTLQHHILVVDDSITTLTAIQKWLSKKFEISTANSAFMAISFLSATRPDLILLDYEMPVCSGALLMEMLRAEPSTRDIPIIFLTSKGDKESVEKVLALKPDGYLLKTMTPDKILEAIEAFLIGV